MITYPKIRPIRDIYRTSLALLTDEYELTTAQAHYLNGTHEIESAFNGFFRRAPFGGYTISAGLTWVIDYIRQFRFTLSDIAFLRKRRGNDDKLLYDPRYLAYLYDMEFECSIWAPREGEIVFPNTPMIRVQGPVLQGQILETAICNLLGFHTLIATKACRSRQSAAHRRIIEGGLRGAQGIDGGLSASYAAYIGGIDATSNALARKLFGIPTGGTFPHAWVSFHDAEMEAFKNYARALPNNVTLLIDTYNTLRGAERAIEIGLWLKEHGFKFGLRLDSGDRTRLSQAVWQKIVDAGLEGNASITLSGDYDEFKIADAVHDGAIVHAFIEGRKLVVGDPKGCADMVYKLAARRAQGSWNWQDAPWLYRIKVSEDAGKTSTPGPLQARRFFDESGMALCDQIYMTEMPPAPDAVPPCQNAHRFEDLLVPIFQNGKYVYDWPSLEQTRSYRAERLSRTPGQFCRLREPDSYPVTLEGGLEDLKLSLIEQASAS